MAPRTVLLLDPSSGRRRAAFDDGLRDVVVMVPTSRREVLRTYPTVLRGTHVHHPGYCREQVRAVRLDSPGTTAYADGERLGALPLDVEVQPVTLRALVPDPRGTQR